VISGHEGEALGDVLGDDLGGEAGLEGFGVGEEAKAA
jgi:hypothetical protein